MLDGGATQRWQATYNSDGLVTSRTDPVGRQTTYTYALNGIDLLEIRQTKPGGSDRLASYSNYVAHRPQTIVDAAGLTTTATYNAAGQVVTVTNPKTETTTYAYNPSGYLTSVTGPVAGSTTTYAYDTYGRIRTVTEADGYAVTTDYDALNRETARTYPDMTTETFTYERLDLVAQQDRHGRITRPFYDRAGRRTATRDPLGRVLRQEWCGCGSLDALIDGAGHRTDWSRDVQGRITREIRADGITDTLYTYDVTGRLKTVTDPKNQVTTHAYRADDTLSSTTYTNAVIATPGVSYTYDAVYPRVATMVDGIGTTTYTYTAPATSGAGQVATVDGPLMNDTITYTYDPLGRVTTRDINAAGVTWAFDALGRITSEVNVLGTFTYTYDGVTPRVATVTYPNSQTSTYSYVATMQDRRLQTIHHKYPSGATLSRFDYTYDTVGNILTWRQQADTAAVAWDYRYDAADQLVAATKRATDPPATVLKRYGYGYDPAANRTVEQIDNTVTGASYSLLNQLVSQQPAGALRVAGTVSEPATMTIAGTPATVTADHKFEGSAPVVSGSNTVTVTATDPSGNAATKQYHVDSTGAAKTFTYDANGNLTSDGTRTFEWDARNQLVAVSVGTHRSEFAYDGEQHRVRIVEKESGVTQSDTKIVWCNDRICEERAADGVTVTRRAFARGEQVAGVARFFAPDHLGSVGEVTDNSSALLARYSYDPWGRRTLTAGVDATSVGYTGHRWQANGGISITLHRGYDAELGRWVSQDPIEFQGGPTSSSTPRTIPSGLPIRSAWRFGSVRARPRACLESSM